MQATLLGFWKYTQSFNSDRFNKIWGNSYQNCRRRQKYYDQYLMSLKKRSEELQLKYEREFFAEVYYGS